MFRAPWPLGPKTFRRAGISWLAVLLLTATSVRAERALTLGVRVEATLAPGARQVYELPARPGDYVELVAEQLGIDLVLSLVLDDGTSLAEIDSPNGDQGEERLRLLLPTSGLSTTGPGDFRVEVKSLRADATPGRYRLWLVAARPASLDDRLRSTADSALRRGRTEVQGDGEALERAVASLIAARDGYRRLGETDGESESLVHLATALRRLGRYREALEQAETARRLGHGTDVERARLHNALALIHRRLGHYEEAATAYGEALELWRLAGSRSGEAMTLHNYAVLEDRRQLDGHAMELYAAALELWTELGREAWRAVTLGHLGRLYKEQGRLALAISHQREALTVLRELGREDLLAAALNNLATSHASIGDFEHSLTLLYEALEIRRRRGIDRETAQNLANLAWVYRMLGEPRRAIPLVGEALELSETSEDHAQRISYHDTLARAYLALAEPRQALATIDQALALARAHDDERGLALGLEVKGRALLELGRPGDAESVLAEALSLSLGLAARVAEANTHDALAELARARDDPDLARIHVERAIAIIESLRLDTGEEQRQASYLALKRTVYESWIDLLYTLHLREPAAGWDERALAASEKAKARSLAESLGLPGIAVAPLGVEAIRERILGPAGPENLLLEIALGEDRSFLWTLDTETVETVVLPGRAALEPIARRLVDSLSRPPSADREARRDGEQASLELSGLLLEPIRHRLGNRRLLWVAEGALLQVPLAALPDPRSTTGEPILLRNEVVTLPSATALDALRRVAERRGEPDRTLAIVADPIFEEAESLPATGAEAEALTRLVPAHDVLLARGAEASRELVLGGGLSDYRLLHFATHGMVDTRYPELSALVLSQRDREGRPVDGLLRLQDFDRLDLRAELIVLSACRTALGKPVRGEGLVGLSRGFLLRGVPRVVASLWQVDDRATAELMEHFYRQMLHEGRGVGDALRRAQLAFWRGEAGRAWRSPYFWAAFQVQGDWRQVARRAVGGGTTPEGLTEPRSER